jgi:hypothetical protein
MDRLKRNADITWPPTVWLKLQVISVLWRADQQVVHKLSLFVLAGHSTDSYVIPLLFLNSTLGDPLLPLTIENQDFSNAISSADNCGKQLLEKWYTLDEKSQPSCYRLNSIKVEKETIASIDDELSSLLLSLVEVFSKELRDSYLTTVVEQEVNNTVLMSQELSKRCIWMQNTGLPSKADENASAADAEMNRRLNHIQNELKVSVKSKQNAIKSQFSVSTVATRREAHHQDARRIAAATGAVLERARNGDLVGN